ncbi:hypothetical protein [Streptomyces aureocirculatus]|uniref:hypothetical protein n=1 Tax=Streptomyces aureocirculatus TaxID=67275 RepID=UPI001CECC086|nr:hypothetical protein [Streptomyces aureocirculatus]
MVDDAAERQFADRGAGGELIVGQAAQGDAEGVALLAQGGEQFLGFGHTATVERN